MRDRFLVSAWLLTACLPALASAQQQPEVRRGEGTWELSAGGGVEILNRGLLDYLSSGSATTRFTKRGDPGRVLPAAVLGLGYNFSRHWGFGLGVEGAGGSGVTYLTPLAALTYTGDLNAKTSPFISVGSQFTRIVGQNGRKTHPTWGANVGLGVRSMVSENLALRLEGRIAAEHYAELPGKKTVYPLLATLGLSYFVGGPHPAPVAAAPCHVCTMAQVRVDTVIRTRVDTAWATRVDTVRVEVRDPSVDQLVLRVQFRTNVAELLPKSRPVLDSIAAAIIATSGSRWEIQGHTDSIGSAEDNRILGQARAQTVLDYLVTKGVDRTALTAVGFGPDRPVFSNSSVYGRAQNRRVQLRRVPAPPTGQPVP